MSSLFAHLGVWGLALTLVLSVRSTHLDQWFRGLNRVFRIHHRIAWVSWALLLVHGAVEAWGFGFSLMALHLTLTEPSLIAGWLALILFTLVVFLAKRRHWPFRLWRRVHLLSLPAWALGAYHLLAFSESFWSLISAWGALTLGTLALFRSQALPRMPFWGSVHFVDQITPLNHRVVELRLKPFLHRGALPPQRRAQYYYLRFKGPEQSQVWHPFTCLSPPGEAQLTFAIKATGRDTRFIPQMEKGLRVDVMGPFGFLAEEKTAGKELWFVAGVGVTPLLSLSRSPDFGRNPTRILHALDNELDQICVDHWSLLQARGVIYKLWLRDQNGYVTKEAVIRFLDDFEGAQIFIAGPDLFIRHIRRILKELSVHPKQIFTEEFVR